MISAAGSGFVSTARLAGASFSRDMRAVVVVVRNEAGQKALEVLPVEDDDVVEEIAACGAYEPLGDSLLPGEVRRAWWTTKNT